MVIDDFGRPAESIRAGSVNFVTTNSNRYSNSNSNHNNSNFDALHFDKIFKEDPNLERLNQAPDLSYIIYHVRDTCSTTDALNERIYGFTNDDIFPKDDLHMLTNYFWVLIAGFIHARETKTQKDLIPEKKGIVWLFLLRYIAAVKNINMKKVYAAYKKENCPNRNEKNENDQDKAEKGFEQNLERFKSGPTNVSNFGVINYYKNMGKTTPNTCPFDYDTLREALTKNIADLKKDLFSEKALQLARLK